MNTDKMNTDKITEETTSTMDILLKSTGVKIYDSGKSRIDNKELFVLLTPSFEKIADPGGRMRRVRLDEEKIIPQPSHTSLRTL